MKKIYLLIIFSGLFQIVISQAVMTDGPIDPQEIFVLNQPLDGNTTYDYKASKYITLEDGFEYEPEAEESFLGEIDPLMVFPPEEGETGGSTSNNEGGFVGTTKGNFTVTPTGAAIYSVPINVAAGTAGMAPDLALTYNSQADDGLLGERWMLSGLSAITVAPKLYYYDQQSEAVVLPQNFGPFYLDGKRLLKVNETDYTIEYRTEVDEMKKIIHIKYTNEFIVYTKSGLKYDYGITEDSRHYLKDFTTGSKTAIAWYVNKISDKNGNYIEFEYYQDLINGELRIKEIRYTGNTNTGLEPYNRIEFVYGEDRDEIIQTHFKTNFTQQGLGFVTAKITKYLTEINCYTVNDELYRGYDMVYGPGGVLHRKHITKIYERVADEIFYNPLIFNWSLQSEEYDFIQSNITGNFANCQYNFGLFTGDFNGNGRTDFINVWYDQNDNSYKFAVNYDNPANPHEYVQKAVRTLDGPPLSINVMDFNGDGFSDVIFKFPDGGNNFKYQYYYSDKNGSPYIHGPWDIFTDVPFNTFTTSDFYGGDFNGDGIGDALLVNNVVEYEDNEVVLYIYWGEISNIPSNYIEYTIDSCYTNFLLGDFDGEGKTEILVYPEHFPNSCETKIIDIYNEQFNFYPVNINLYGSNKYLAGDFNGDKKSDLIQIQNDNTLKIYHSYGNKFTFQGSLNQNNIFNDLTYIGDFNGDGRSDIMISPDYHNGGSWDGIKILLANTDGEDFTSVNVNLNVNPLIHTDTKLFLGDFNGNGRTDFISSENSLTSPEYFIYEITEGYQNSPRNLITSVINGIGDEFEINYEPLTNPTVYSPDDPEGNKGNIDYPVSKFIGAIYLVQNILHNSPAGCTQLYYFYQAARTHRYGKGFLGFKAFEQTDMNTYIKTIQYFDYDETFYHLYAKGTKIKQELFPYTVISFQENNINFKINPDNSLVFFPYSGMSFLKVFDLNGNFVKSSKTETDYDDYGNLTYMITLNGDYNGTYSFPPNSVFDYWEEVTNTYLPPDKTNWILGRLQNAIVTKHIPIPNPNPSPPVQDITVSSEFEYYTNGMLWKEIYEPSDPKSVTKEYVYDDYGNIIKTIRSTAGIDDRIIETYYDTDLPESERKGRFLTKIINGLGHTETKVYDQVKGFIQQITGPNSFTTEFQYDDFGNLVKTIGHNKVESASVLRWINENDPDLPDFDNQEPAVYYSWQQQSGLPPVRSYYDNRGKLIRTVNIGFDGTKIYTDYYYNYFDLLVSVSDPYFKGTPEADIQYTTFDYDILKRKIKTTAPGDRITTIDYNGLTTEATNPNGQVIKKVMNELGWTIRSYDASEDNYVDFVYYSNGTLRSRLIHNHPETEIVKQYDVFGNCTSVVDPSLGTLEFEYNGFGELTKKIKNGKIVADNFVYDVLGRLLEMQEPSDDRKYFYLYDTEPFGIGKISNKRVLTNANSLINKISYSYDDYGRVKNETEIINVDGQQQIYATSYKYDVFSRLKRLIYPSGFSVSYKYNQNGYLGKIIRNTDHKTIWELTEMNARQQIVQTHLGNGLNTTNDYYSTTGFLKSINTGKQGVDIQDLGYGWDDIGNLKWRDKTTQQGNYLLEEFDFDNLNRLKQVDVDYYTGQASVELDYDELGRILYKKSSNPLFHVANNYSYEGDGDNNPYNLWKIDNLPAFYQNEDQNIFYTNFNKISSIIQGNKSLDITYGLGHSRVVQKITDLDNDFEQTKVYVGGNYEKITENGETKEVHYISAGDGLCAIYTKNNQSSDEFVYVHKDHLGSIQAITDETGLLIEEFSYDAWGLRRDPNTWIPFDDLEQNLTDRGFTGHEHLDLFSLINMNGRMYDPVLGYFTSPDPVTQLPGYTQGFNRYSYVFNNPLSMSNPSGYYSMPSLSFTWDDVYSTVATGTVIAIAVIASIETAGIAAPYADAAAAAVLGGAVGGFIGGFGVTVINGGNYNDALSAGLQGAFFGAISAGLASSVGTAFKTVSTLSTWRTVANEIGRALAHGVVQGMIRVAQGGKFEQGFLSGAVSSISGSVTLTGGLSSGMSVVIGGVLGGTAEALGGGKFANGAITGAFVVLFNHLGHPPQNKRKYPGRNELEQEFKKDFKEKVIDELSRKDLSKLQGEPKDWAKQIAEDLLSTKLEAENMGYGLEPIEVVIRVYDGPLEGVIDGNTIYYNHYIPSDYIELDWLPTVINPGYDPIPFKGPDGLNIGVAVKYRYLEPL